MKNAQILQILINETLDGTLVWRRDGYYWTTYRKGHFIKLKRGNLLIDSVHIKCDGYKLIEAIERKEKLNKENLIKSVYESFED